MWNFGVILNLLETAETPTTGAVIHQLQSVDKRFLTKPPWAQRSILRSTKYPSYLVQLSGIYTRDGMDSVFYHVYAFFCEQFESISESLRYGAGFKITY
jgi:hypothetical protein